MNRKYIESKVFKFLTRLYILSHRPFFCVQLAETEDSHTKSRKNNVRDGMVSGIGTRCRAYNRIHCCLFYIYANFTSLSSISLAVGSSSLCVQHKVISSSGRVLILKILSILFFCIIISILEMKKEEEDVRIRGRCRELCGPLRQNSNGEKEVGHT